jgi:hypothetical protein
MYQPESDLKVQLRGIVVLFLAPFAIFILLCTTLGICVKEAYLLLIRDRKFDRQIKQDLPIES